TEILATAKLAADHAELARFTFLHAATERLRLAEPARFAWKPNFTIENLSLAAPPASGDAPEKTAPARLALGFSSGAEPVFSLSAASLDSAWFTDLIDLGPARWQIADAALSGGWQQDGPLVAAIKTAGRVEFADGHAITVGIDAKTTPDCIAIADFTLGEKGAAAATATGRVPLVVLPRQTPAWRFDSDAPFEIDARTAPASPFWQTLSSVTGIALENPSLHARVAGSWKKPASFLDIAIDRLEFDPVRWPAKNIPPATGLAAAFAADAGAFNITGFSVNLAGQSLRASGRVLAPAGGWHALAKNSLGELMKLPREFHIEIPGADLAALAPYSAGILIPRGRLSADIHLRPGGAHDGLLRLSDGALRPVGPLGAIRGIEIESRLAGRLVEITRATALVGGQPVTLAGSAAFRPGAQPVLDLAFKGKNIPFVRRPGFLMRGDIDLRARTDSADVTRLTGDVRLRDSLFLADIRSLWPDTPGGGPASRPPFFSIDTPPFNDWRLDINVRGNRFLRLRTTLATGRLSAGFRLDGTLGEPRAVGDITMPEGRVLFPFANFSVNTGRVRITQANPFAPVLEFRATTSTLGYDLAMSLTGTPGDPQLSFSSSPALSSAEILLLVMAGQSPGDDFNITDQQRVFRLSAYLSQGILEQLFGIDMGGDRLSLSSGDKVTQQGRETYLLEYKIDNRWAVVGEYDEFDDYNIGLKWRFYQSKPARGKNHAHDKAPK
ncbi:MAG: translocation/assembly module TamB, partial [Opitutaceae bacterium]|nr:translocation/assembly module TamB [Opitutaceae bacterium]